ncbi:MAG: histidinol-phosphate transaminase [Spirochaetota bacterium]|nr:histidinol-phosphate transaminase [Spirochaetota bacterium]
MRYWNSRLQKMSAYIPGEQPDKINEYIKLNTNENPFSPSEVVLNAIKSACNEQLRLYPNVTSQSLRESFAKLNNIEVDNIFVGNGSDEIFTLIFRGFIDPDGSAAFPYPSYSLYYTMAEANGIKYDRINLTDEMDVDFTRFLEKQYNLVIVGNPNNPTGKGCDEDEIRIFLDQFNGLLVVDEAYVDFYGETVIELVEDYDNLIVTRSFSKSYSLAGLRIGLAVANRDIIKGLFKLKDSYNVDRLAEVGARAALLDIKGFEYNIRLVLDNKEYLEENLEELGFDIIPSKANFLFVKHPEMPSKDIFELLKEKKILVRYFDGSIQSDYIRITVGTMLELKALIKELTSILEA